MSKETVLCLCRSDAVRYAAQYLSDLGVRVTISPRPDVTHVLLPVPSSAVMEELSGILQELPGDVVVSGGNLGAFLPQNDRAVDFLQDPYYLADNAAITAECALEIVENKLGTGLAACHVLVLGWGRIGKCLGKLLQSRGADVTIAARKDSDLAMIHALGYHSVPISQAGLGLDHYQVILNTVPVMILPDMQTAPDCIAVELASKPGMSGGNIISARGLPGKIAPAASGKLIARTFIRLSLHKED